MIRIASVAGLRAPSFTLELWFEARSTSLGDRLVIGGGNIGGEGVDILEWYGRRITYRPTKGAHAVMNTPSVGSITTKAPPDHMGQCAEAFHKKGGPEHMVYMHDGTARRVKIFIGLEGKPLRLCYDGTYTGKYSTSKTALLLGNVAKGHKPHPSDLYQFSFYDKLLTHTVNPTTREVTYGELLTNHAAGSSATVGGAPDAGPPPADAALPKDTGTASTACKALLSASHGQALQTLSVSKGSGKRLKFVIAKAPHPSGLTKASLSMRLHDADHPGIEGTVYLNGKGPLALPAKTTWNNTTSDTSLGVPVTMLAQGSNTVEFGAGSGPSTYYKVGQVSLSLWGPACGAAGKDSGPVKDSGPAKDSGPVKDSALVKDTGAAPKDGPTPAVDSGEAQKDRAIGDLLPPDERYEPVVSGCHHRSERDPLPPEWRDPPKLRV